jgi:hypothetical protein
VSQIIVVTMRSPEVVDVGKSLSESGHRMEWYSSSLQVGLLVEEVCAKPQSYASDDTAEVTWPQCDVNVESSW